MARKAGKGAPTQTASNSTIAVIAAASRRVVVTETVVAGTDMPVPPSPQALCRRPSLVVRVVPVRGEGARVPEFRDSVRTLVPCANREGVGLWGRRDEGLLASLT